MSLPFAEPLTLGPPESLVIPEPHRRHEGVGAACGVCSGRMPDIIWADESWSLYNPAQTALLKSA